MENFHLLGGRGRIENLNESKAFEVKRWVLKWRNREGCRGGDEIGNYVTPVSSHNNLVVSASDMLVYRQGN